MVNNTLQSIGGFSVALVIFAGIAIFLILRLRSVLGKRVGFEKPPVHPGNAQRPNGPVIDARALPPEPGPGRSVPDPRSPLGQRLMQIVNRDQHFDPPQFLIQAETAFRTIVTAFAAGDRKTLQNLLTPHVYQTFEQAIATREASGEGQKTEIKSIISVVIEDAQLVGDTAIVVVRFISAQLNQRLDASGAPIPGSEEQGDLNDLWTFERNLPGSDPVWRLSAARSG
ncbi:Tim44/TimA family putative adaptor protein [Acidocella aminolytica]|uniref:Mitochondrial import inner membrane translocase subunit Tim44 n=1 Tax=Acidocella aminolytica 101 = DSM 11237 TaxID=1120923 RepID=A0A0D6PKT7_9PROT|nr:Tim44/TimA family putative adaptor protein [Acidocella aminolytica]GAN81359.1 mitochondrial import inner membrane translocase subunit Tim44 [Acidocella aminolytica 101 = DSM 11237]GBQ33594.1 putative transporter [Acidocella aminolytica 101 = DSM 11237]SHF42947.1 Predicted lipid-binding transport protein, Tim44 family [Acidocella aminolytica 101 = DSM 11237]